MAEPDETIEDIAANLLTGVMVFLLGAAMPMLALLQIVSRPDLWTAAPSMKTLLLPAMLVGGIYLGFGGMRWGLRLIRIHLKRLRNRRPSSVSG
jgi:hypothetical protein